MLERMSDRDLALGFRRSMLRLSEKELSAVIDATTFRLADKTDLGESKIDALGQADAKLRVMRDDMLPKARIALYRREFADELVTAVAEATGFRLAGKTDDLPVSEYKALCRADEKLRIMVWCAEEKLKLQG